MSNHLPIIDLMNENARLKEQLVKRTKALEDIRDTVAPNYGGTIGAIRKCAIAALTDDLQKSDCRHEDYCLHPNCECEKSTEPGYTQYTGFRP